MMAEANDKISILSQNLTDAGCNEQMAKTCMSFVEKGELQAMLPLLLSLIHIQMCIRDRVNLLAA